MLERWVNKWKKNRSRCCWNLLKGRGRRMRIWRSKSLIYFLLSRRKIRISLRRNRKWFKFNLIPLRIILLRMWEKTRMWNLRKLWAALLLSCLLNCLLKDWPKRMIKKNKHLWDFKIFPKRNWIRWESKSSFLKIKKLEEVLQALLHISDKILCWGRKNKLEGTMIKLFLTMTQMIESS